MQKFLVVLLAVCLVTVHAFVKRDAPSTGTAKETDNNYLDTLQKQFGDLSQQINDKLKTAFNPDEMKKGFNDAIAQVNKAFDDIKARTGNENKQN